MRLEFERDGLPVAILGVNIASAHGDQGALASVCSFPLFQDLDEVDLFSLLGGIKDDLFVFDRAGRLAAYLPILGPSTDLTTDKGYRLVKDTVLEVVNASP